MSDTFVGVDDSILNEKDHLKDVREAVSALAAVWDEFGGHLGLQKPSIEIIGRNFAFSAERQLTEVVAYWLRWNYDYEKLGKPSWKILVKAVHFMNPELADSIAQKHQGMGNDSSRKRRRSQPQQSVAAAASEIDGVDPKAVKFRRMSNDCSSPTSEEKNAPADPRWCTADTKFKALSGHGTPVPGVPAGVAVIQALWNKKELKLGVKFIGKESMLSGWKLKNGNKMTTETIITWANTWRYRCLPVGVPYFVDVATEPGLEDDIRVDFNDTGVNWSRIGMEATQFPGEATMQLSLKNAWSDDLKRHYVIHEFGHVLGLGHEHQRSKFWLYLNAYANLELIKQDPDVGGEDNFNNNWAEKAVSYYSSDLGTNTGEYDPHSIMHYGFKIEWLDKTTIGGKDYSNLDNIEADYKKKILSKDAYKVLYGVHQRKGLNLVNRPSDEDISFLSSCYAATEPGISSQQGHIQAIIQNEVIPSSGPRTTASSPPQQEPEDYDEGSTANNTTSLPEDVATWSVEQVSEYFNSDPDGKEYAQFFREQKIKGKHLLKLTKDDLLAKVEIGMAMDIMEFVEKLKQK